MNQQDLKLHLYDIVEDCFEISTIWNYNRYESACRFLNDKKNFKILQTYDNKESAIEGHKYYVTKYFYE